MKHLFLLALLILCSAGYAQQPYVLVLGTAQDGGYPHIGCEQSCCEQAWDDVTKRKFVVSLALVDPGQKKWWLFEATPDIKEQLRLFASKTNHEFNFLPDGIFITHAHIGHYTGLMQLGKEALNSKNVPVYALPKLRLFFNVHGPWSQLVQTKNIRLQELNEEFPLTLTAGVIVTPFKVPHRDEYSETAGFKIITPQKRYLFIPDIDKWAKFEKDIVKEVRAVDVAFLDATFLSGDELSNRNISEVPHPLVSETMELFKNESNDTRSKIHFIHFNHTNPLLYDVGVRKKLMDQGFNITEQALRY
jgi:pyrroloquinoline quinone biosynthesis protein B